jgi:hypothetical protein
VTSVEFFEFFELFELFELWITLLDFVLDITA